MALPIFSAHDDPGSNFPELLRRLGIEHNPWASATPVAGPGVVQAQPGPGGPMHTTGGAPEHFTPHATTCVALRYADGVVMAGDRRATSGNLISHRMMDKIAEADRMSGVAFAGAAGPGLEMLRLFQLQLEHYEKVEGMRLSLEGKANQLSMMIRGNLQAAYQGLVVVPIFAGFDERQRIGRLWAFDVTGGRYEEREHVATGSGSLHAGTVIKVGYNASLSRDDAVSLAARALWEAADADSATGGPDALRGIYPTVATITEDGFVRVDDSELATTFESIAEEVRAR